MQEEILLFLFFTLWALFGQSTARREADTELSVQDMEKALLTGSGNRCHRFPAEEMRTRRVTADVAEEFMARGLTKESPITTRTVTAPTSFLECIFPRRASLGAKMLISESQRRECLK